MESMETDLDTTLTESNQPQQVAAAAAAAAAASQQQQGGAPQQQPMEQPGQQGGGVQQPRPGGQNSMDTEELIPTLPELGEELSRYVNKKFSFQQICLLVFKIREGGDWAVYYTGPQSFLITFSYSLAQQLWALIIIFIGWIIKLSVKTFQPLIVNYRRSNFIYCHCRCI